MNDLQEFVVALGPFLASLRGRVLTPGELAKLRQIRAAIGELRMAIVFDVEPDEGSAVRRVLGAHEQARA